MATAKRRAKRDERAGWAKAKGFSLTKRDMAILYAVGRCKVLGMRDLVALFFGARSTASDRLRKLHVHGYLTVHVESLNHENLYTLTEKGRRAIVDELEIEPAAVHVPRALPARIDHLIALNRTRVLLTVATRDANAPFALAGFRPEWELLAERHAALIGLVPDAICELADAQGRVTAIAIEADAATEAPTVIARKIARYDMYARTGQPLYGVDVRSVLVVAPGVRRVRSLARAVLAAAPTTVSVRLAELHSLTAANLFEQFHRPARWLAEPPALA